MKKSSFLSENLYSSVNACRIILILNSISTILLFLLLKTTSVTFAENIQTLLTGISLAGFIVSFNRLFRPFIKTITIITVLLYLIYSSYLTLSNSHSPYFIIQFTFCFLLITLVLESVQKLLLIFIIPLILLILLFGFFPVSQVLLSAAFFITILTGVFILSYFRIIILQRFKMNSHLVKILFKESPEAVLVVDPEKDRVTNFNEVGRQFFGDEFQNKSFRELFCRFFSQDNYSRLNQALLETGKFSEETSYFRQDKTEAYASLQVTTDSRFQKPFWLIRINDISEKITDKKAIEENRKILLQIINLLPHQVYLKDSAGRFVLINKALAVAHGRNEEELIGKTDFDIFPYTHAERLSRIEKEVLEQNRTLVNPDERYLTDSGKYQYVHSVKMPFHLNVRETGLLGINLDVTEAREAERAIRESEAKYKMLMEQASDGIIISDRDGLVIEANAKVCELFGYTLEELKKRSVKDLAESEYKPEHYSYFKGSVIVERRFKRKDGTIITVEVSAKQLPDGRHQAIIRDITIRKKLEKILKDSERKFRALIENSSDFIAILSSELLFSFVSNSAERILGYPPESLLGKKVEDFIIEEEKERFVGTLKNTFDSPGQNVCFEEVKWIHAKGKDCRIFEVVAVNLLEDSVVNGIVLNCHDITKRKLTENELLNTNFELDSFVYKASHDLKAPLRSIMGLIKLAKIESSDPTQHMYLNMMSKSVNSLDQFIKDLTQFSRNSRMHVSASKIDFEGIVSEAVSNLQFSENAEKVRIIKTVQNKANFYSDLTRISTIINNLLSNAFKYHRFENNNPYINIEIVTSLDEAVINVEDNGQGIDPKYIDKIFDMFFRASESSYGSGLGLYIVKSALNKLQGTIVVDSCLNKGTRFVVKIPNLINDINNDGNPG